MKSGWRQQRLGDLCQLISGQHIDSKDYNSECRGIGYLTGPSDFGPINPVISKWTECPKVTAKNGDILVTVKGSGVGKLNSLDQDEVAISRQLMAVRVIDADRRFIYAYLESAFDHLQSLSTGAAIPGISRDQILGLEIAIPSITEQQRIVGILDEAFEGITTAKANAEKNLHNARTLFESHLQSVFIERDKGWVEKCLGDVCSFSSGGTPSKANSSYWNGTIPWISGRDMKSERLSDAVLHISQEAVDDSSTRIAPTGALLVLVRGMGLAHGAQIAELMAPCAFNQDIRAIHPDREVLSRYLLFALRTRINYSKNVLSNAAHGTLKIDMDALRNLAIPVPPLQEQHQITRLIDSLISETRRLESLYQQKLTALDALKKSLLHQAFSGGL